MKYKIGEKVWAKWNNWEWKKGKIVSSEEVPGLFRDTPPKNYYLVKILHKTVIYEYENDIMKRKRKGEE